MQKMNKLLATMQQQLATSMEAVEAEARRMDEAAAVASGGKAEPVTQCKVASNLVSGSIGLFGNTGYLYTTPSWRVCAQNARAALVKAREELDAQHQANLPLAANNAEVRRRVYALMAHLGIPESRTSYGYATSRARKMTQTVKTAGFVGDLQELCKTTDGYDICVRQLNEFEQRIVRYEADEQRKEGAVTEKAQAERAERNKLVLLGALAQKYACEPELGELMEAMCRRDKYFGLAYWLERNRNNWSEDGPSRAETGLSYFTVESEEDQAIQDDIQRHITDWEGDGRVFRDTQYNYGVLYGMVKNMDLLEDLKKLQDAGLAPSD